MPSPQWPLFYRLAEEKWLSPLDCALAHRLLREEPEADQDVALLVCHLMLAAKEGHLCVEAGSELAPSVASLWRNGEGLPPNPEEERALAELILAGAQKAPSAVVSIREQGDASIPHAPICREGNLFYLQRHWVFETLFLTHLKRHLKTPPALSIDLHRLESDLARSRQEQLLSDEQAEVVLKSCSHVLAVVTGGPGTGKTYTAGRLIEAFLRHLSEAQRESCEIALAAPTGKAAANLEQSLNRAGISSIKAQTLHNLLNIHPSKAWHTPLPLTADLVVVDESSMIDVRMMTYLFQALKPGSRLILLGDPNQLPSVEAGSLLVDLIRLGSSESPLPIPCLSLSHCLRAELKSLVELSQDIHAGATDRVLSQLNGRQPGLSRLRFSEEAAEAQRQLAAYAAPAFSTFLDPGEAPEALLAAFQRFRLLSPLRKGMLGAEALNEAILQCLCRKAPKGGHAVIPILIAANDHRQELFNGETGLLIRRLPWHSWDSEAYALFPSRTGMDEVRRLPALLLPKYELAYCLSVHKSQGSEFERVLLVLPEGSESFGREVLYTAVTRARRSIEVYGSDATLAKTVARRGWRLSGIARRAADDRRREGEE